MRNYKTIILLSNSKNKIVAKTYRCQSERIWELYDLKEPFVGNYSGDIGGPPKQDCNDCHLAGRESRKKGHISQSRNVREKRRKNNYNNNKKKNRKASQVLAHNKRVSQRKRRREEKEKRRKRARWRNRGGGDTGHQNNSLTRQSPNTRVANTRVPSPAFESRLVWAFISLKSKWGRKRVFAFIRIVSFSNLALCPFPREGTNNNSVVVMAGLLEKKMMKKKTKLFVWLRPTHSDHKPRGLRVLSVPLNFIQ